MSSTVNRPTVTAQKEADINRKLQIYGIYSAFQQGKVPSNDQIDVALNSFLESKALSSPPGKLSDDGKALVKDVRVVVEEAKKLILSKNDGNLIQDLFWQTKGYDYKSIKGPDAPLKKDQAKRDGEEALEGLRTLSNLLLTNGQFRKLLKDTTILLRDVAGDAATNAAGKVKPSDEELAQVDKAAEDGTWHEKWDLSKETWKKRAQSAYGGKPGNDAKDVADAAKAEAEADATGDAAGVTKEKTKSKLSDRLSPEAKEKLKQRNEEYRKKAKEYYNKKMPAERKDQIIFRLKKIVIECQQHPDYSKAIQTLLKLAENYGKHGSALGKSTGSSAKEARNGFDAAEKDLRLLIERFANGTSTQGLWDELDQFYKAAKKDEELSGWFKSLDTFVRRALLEQGYVVSEASQKEGNRLYEAGRYLLREKYRGLSNKSVNELKFVADQFDKDPQNKAFGQALQKLFNDLGKDQDGKPAFKPQLLKDLTDVIIPAVLENVAYIPIPRIEYSDPQFDAIIENLVLESDNFAPNVLEVASDHFFRWGRKNLGSRNKNSFDIKVSGIQMDLRDVSFHVKRKQGFPSISDTGLVDIILPGDGFSFRIKASSADKKDKQHFVKVDKVDVDFKSLKFKVKKSKFKLLFSLLKPIALKAMRPAIKKAVESAIKDQVTQLDGFLYEVKQEADKAAALSKESSEKAPNVYKRHYDAFQKLMLEKKEKKAQQKPAKSDDKKVNIAMTKEDSIFPDIELPSGISTKATEYRDLARKGEKWESPVFSVGSAKRSTNIPPAPKIERKVAPAATNGSSNGASGTVNGKSVQNAANGSLPYGQTVNAI